MADELVTIPADLTLLSDSELSELETRAVAEFDRLQADDNVTPEILEYQMRLTNDLDRVRAETAGRAARAAQAAAQERARLRYEGIYRADEADRGLLLSRAAQSACFQLRRA